MLQKIGLFAYFLLKTGERADFATVRRRGFAGLGGTQSKSQKKGGRGRNENAFPDAAVVADGYVFNFVAGVWRFSGSIGTYSGNERRGYMFKYLKKLTKNNQGMGTVEIILIIVVLIGLVLIFKNQIMDITKTIFEKIAADSSAILA